MRSHAKAPSAGSISARQLLLAGALTLLTALAFSTALAGSAKAASVHLFKEAFGSASQPTFTAPQGLAIDQSTGDVIAIERGVNEKQVVALGGTGLGGTFKLTLTTAKGVGQSTSGSAELTGVRTSIGTFKVRDSISGANIPPGTTIVAVGAGTLTLSNNATATGAISDLLATESTAATGTGDTTASNKFVKNVNTTTGNFTVGQRIEGAGIAAGTTIAKVVSATELELSVNATATAPAVSISAPGVPFNVTTANLNNAIVGLPGIGTGNTATSGTAGSTYTVEFKGTLGFIDVDAMSCDGSGLTGTSPTCSPSTSVPGVLAGLRKFHANGTPSNFSGLGTNVIDGRRGPGGRTLAECASEAASCDETPLGGFIFGSPDESQVAIDNSGGATNGNIYVTEVSRKLVDVFAADGHYLGQLTQYRANEEQKIEQPGFAGGDQFTLGNLPAGCSATTTDPIVYAVGATGQANILAALEAKCGNPSFANFSGSGNAPTVTVSFQGQFASQDVAQLSCTKLTGAGSCVVSTTLNGLQPASFGEVCGVAVDPLGSVYAGEFTKNQVHKFTPSSNPPTTADSILNLKIGGVSGLCTVSSGAGPTAGFVFAGKENSAIYKLDAATGALKYQVATGSNITQTVNPASGRLLAAIGSTITEYDVSGPSSATQASTLTAASTIQGIAVNGATGNVYVSRSGSSTLDVYGPVVSTPTVVAHSATEISTTKATLNGSVNAEGNAVSVCKFEYLTQAAYQGNGNSFSGANVPQAKSCAESIPVDAASHPVSAAISGLQANTTYRYRLFAENGAGGIVSVEKTLTTSPPVFTGDATGVTDTTATLNGTVNPVGAAFTACKFEYLTAEEYAENNDSYSGLNTPASKNCTPSAGSIEADFQAHTVSANLTGLAKNTTYHFRLSATNASGTATGADKAFTTPGPPQIVNQWAFVKQTSATLSARIDPSGFATTYHFEWGTDDSYGNRVPADVELFVGSGTTPVEVSAEIAGLQEATAYHYRVVASSSSGTTEGDDREFITLNDWGLPNDRGAELVSPADKRPVGVVGEIFLANEGQMLSQASEDGGALVYPLMNGTADSTAGGLLRFRAAREPGGWLSTQVSSPSLIPPPQLNGLKIANPSLVLHNAPDLSCGLLVTYNPLTADTPEFDVESGVYNLYRWNADGSYQLVSNRVPLNPNHRATGVGRDIYYSQVEASEDCSRVYFRSIYDLLPGASGLYEWDEGTLRDAGTLPGGGVGVDIPLGTGSPGPAVLGGESVQQVTSRWNAVSPDGSRLFFSAISDEAPDNGKLAVFVREDGEATDVSRSKTAVPNNGALYETASPDGSHVFFRANYGIAATSSAGATNGACGQVLIEGRQVEKIPCDLYDYDVESGELTDLSADPNPADPIGAAAQGVVAVSDDGSHVYFAALGQLVPGKGNTYAENIAGFGSANIYLAHDGELDYVTTLAQRNPGAGELFGGSPAAGAALMRKPNEWTAATSKDGRKLLFVSSGNLTGYESGGVQEAYLYAADTGEIVCLSCRPDGLPSVHTPETAEDMKNPLPTGFASVTSMSNYRPRAMSEDGSRVFFSSPDVLAPGGVAVPEDPGNGEVEKTNVYEWEDGQVYFLAVAKRSGGSGMGRYLDASASGDDVFISTSERLVPQDFDFGADAYDLRVSGGFRAEPPPVPCVPAADQCQGTPSPQPASTNPASGTFNGPGNPAPSSQATKGKPHKKHRKKKAKKQRKSNRPTKSNRGGAK